MKIIKSKTIGYCHGVALTLEKAQMCLDLAKSKNKPAYSIGTLIHNSDVVKAFSGKGLKVISDASSASGVALVRAHGIPDNERNEFEKKGYELIDATCINIQHTKDVIKNAFSQNRTVVILGVKGHAETLCLEGTENVTSFLVSSEEDLNCLFEKVPNESKITLVCQTTFPQTLYESLSNQIISHYRDCEIGNHLCADCIRRKNEALKLSEMCDAVVVVGGKNSENTKDLALYVSMTGKPVIHIENVNDFNRETDEEICKYETVGVCSGTSTPMNIIEDVISHLSALER